MSNATIVVRARKPSAVRARGLGPGKPKPRRTIPDNELSDDERNSLAMSMDHYCMGLARDVHARNPAHSPKDIYQAAMLGVILASRRYSAARQTKFSTYAVWWAKSYVFKVIDQSRLLRGFRAESSMMPRVETLESYSGGESHSRELLCDDVVDSIEDFIETTTINELKEVLDGQHRAVIDMRYTGKGMMLEEIGHVIGKSKERVRQIINAAVDTMRAKLNNRDPE